MFRKDLVLFGDATLEEVRLRIRVAAVRLLMSATPESRAVREQLAITPHIYKVDGLSTYVATRSERIDASLASSMGLTLVLDYWFYRDGDQVMEVVSGVHEVPTLEVNKIKSANANMQRARNLKDSAQNKD